MTSEPFITYMPITEGLIQTAGVLAGALGVSAALILQMVVGRKCNPWHIAFLFSLGSISLLYNIGGYTMGAPTEATVHAAAVLLTLVLEGFLIYYVWRHADGVVLPVGDSPLLKDGK
jgi:hypothetical protein